MSNSSTSIEVVCNSATVGACHNDDEDPLGLLPGALRASHLDVHNRVDKQRSASSYLPMGPETATSPGAPGGDCYGSGDPRETIDAILISSKAVRNQVSFRQAHILNTYKAENQQLHKDLSLLPPTYTQYSRAVRERAISRRRRRSSPTRTAGITATPASVSHPLNFHLHGSVGTSAPPANIEGEEPSTGLPAEGAMAPEIDRRARESDGEAGGGGGGRQAAAAAAAAAARGIGAGLRGDRKEGGNVGLVEEGAVVSGNEEVADDQGNGRRFSTLARAGSVSENAAARTLWPCRAKPPGEEDVPALRRSKVRGREMVFALLEAARVEEEDMEEMFLTCPPPTSAIENEEEGGEGRRRREVAFRRLDEARRRNARELDALMEEYDARPSRSRREKTLNKLRKALPWPAAAPSTSSAVGGRGFQAGEGVDTNTAVAGDDEHEPGISGREGETGLKIGDGDDDSDYYADDFADGGDRAEPGAEEGAGVIEKGGSGSGGGGGGGRVRGRGAERGSDRPHSRCGADDRGRGRDDSVSCGSSGNGGDGRGNGRVGASSAVESGMGAGIGDSSTQSDVDDSRGSATGGKSVPDTPSDNNGNGPPDVAPETGEGGEENPRKTPPTGQRKKPTLPDPNELNDSVMADPFNMDHMKDLPGLSGGDNLGLSKLVSAHVTFMDPAFPNLEFHRRAGMDRAGYFMPGYKPQVNSPGPAAGAYWLERRQSYRVKMAAPQATRDFVKNNNVDNNSNKARIGTNKRRSGKRRQHHHRRRSPPKQA